jgi:hypothetical protein
LPAKINVFSRSVPSTADRLSRIAGIFSKGHGPSVELMKEASDFESSVLDNLRNALSFVQKGFADISRKQDHLCGEYERQAANIVGQMAQQD